MNTTVKIKKLNKSAIIPTRGSNQSAGYDLYACVDTPVNIHAHCTEKIPTGLAIEIPDGYFGGIFARSGLATKHGLRPSNCCGVVDSDYRGNVIVALHNDTNEEKLIMPGERIAQLVVMPYIPVNFEEVDALSDTGRGDKGFGDSGRF